MARTGPCGSSAAGPDSDQSPLPLQPDTMPSGSPSFLLIGYRTRHTVFKRIENAQWITPDLRGKQTGIVTRCVLCASACDRFLIHVEPDNGASAVFAVRRG